MVRKLCSLPRLLMASLDKVSFHQQPILGSKLSIGEVRRPRGCLCGGPGNNRARRGAGAFSSHASNCVLESRVTFELDNGAVVHLLVFPAEVQSQGTEDGHDGELKAGGDPESQKVFGSVLLAVGHGGDDATQSAHADLQRRRHRPFRLRPDVVGLVGQNRGDVGLSTGGAQKESKVSETASLVIGGDHQTDDADRTVECNHGRAKVVSISHPRHEEGDRNREELGWGREKVGDTGRVTHSLRKQSQSPCILCLSPADSSPGNSPQ